MKVRSIHLTGRGNRRERIYEDETDQTRFLELLERSLERYAVSLHAFMLMRWTRRRAAEKHLAVSLCKVTEKCQRI